MAIHTKVWCSYYPWSRPFVFQRNRAQKPMTAGPWWTLASLPFMFSVQRHENDILTTVRCGNICKPIIHHLYEYIGSGLVNTYRTCIFKHPFQAVILVSVRRNYDQRSSCDWYRVHRHPPSPTPMVLYFPRLFPTLPFIQTHSRGLDRGPTDLLRPKILAIVSFPRISVDPNLPCGCSEVEP
jgi:hypothetical protein